MLSLTVNLRWFGMKVASGAVAFKFDPWSVKNFRSFLVWAAVRLHRHLEAWITNGNNVSPPCAPH